MHKLYARIAVALNRESLRREEGQGAVEYALVVLGVAAIIAAAVAGFTTEITAFMGKAGAKLATFVP